MLHSPLQRRLIELIEPAALQHGFELVTVEILGRKQLPTVTVLLDREEGLNLETIVEANAWVEELLDSSDVIETSYTLEVSSPGIDRPLRKPSDFITYAGNDVVVKIEPVVGQRSVFKGVLKGIEEGSVIIDIEDETERIELSKITKARVKGVIDFKNSEKE